MQFLLFCERLSFINYIFIFKNVKIHSIFEPYGSGKTTYLILVKIKYNNICYLNLSALNRIKDIIFLN